MLKHSYSNLSISIRLHMMCRHGKGWNESKTKVYHTLWCIYKGNLFLEINDKVLEVTEGDVVLFYPGDTYRAYSFVDCEFLVYFFALETGNGMDCFHQHNLAGVYKSERLAYACRRHCTQYLERFDANATVGVQLYSFFLAFLAEVIEEQSVCLLFEEEMKAAQDTVMQRVVEYMKQHYTENIPIAKLAELADMSEKYFIRQFHFHMAVTPKQYQVELRMKRAIELLTEREISIAEIAAELGYSDQYCFSKAFRKYYGEAPSVFRKHIM